MIPETENFIAELGGIFLAIQYLVENDIDYNIFTDSLLAIQTLTNRKKKCELACNIVEYTHSKNKTIHIAWIRAHNGDIGKKFSDLETKNASVDGENFCGQQLETTYQEIRHGRLDTELEVHL